MKRGFILLARDLLENDLWRLDSDHLRLWVYLLLKANFSKTHFSFGSGDARVTVKTGELLRSYRHISEDCTYSAGNKMVRWSTSRIGRMIKVLEEDGRIRVLSQGQFGTHILINNYEERQDFSAYKNTNRKEPGTPQEHLSPNNKQIKENKHTKKLWDIWLEEFSSKPPHPKLTRKRLQCLDSLFTEQLQSKDNPSEYFREICLSVKASPHHMGTRAYQQVESLFRNEERRERWALSALNSPHHKRTAGIVPRTWSVEQ
jgi:hypothetical protein